MEEGRHHDPSNRPQRKGERMSWAIGYDDNWKRDVGYGVPSLCDHPKCMEEIDRGLGYICGDGPYGEGGGCGLFFCEEHQINNRCARCRVRRKPFVPKPDLPEWINYKATHPSWVEWRQKVQVRSKGVRG